jgi:anti-sigma regulatory factor (Ser/Thr protein kinase)
MSKSRPVDLKVKPSKAQVVEVRDTARQLLADLPADLAQEVLLALDEAVANAIRYGSTGGQPIDVSIVVGEDWVELSVADRGPTAHLPALPHEPPPLLATGGRGLWLILQLADEVRVERFGAGTRLALRRRVRVPAMAGTRG